MDIFATEYGGAPFILFGSAHLATLALILLLNLLLLRLRGASELTRKRIRYLGSTVFNVKK